MTETQTEPVVVDPAAPGQIFRAIPAIIAEVGELGKDGENESQRYRFRSIDSIFNRLNALLAKHRVFWTTEVLGEATVTSGKNAKGNSWIHVLATVRHTFYASDGSHVSTVTLGEAADYGDKAANKAHAFALKVALSHLFCIPYARDGDADSPDLDDSGGERVGSAKAALDEFLSGKVPAHQPPPPTKDDSEKAEAKQVFMRAIQELADRDCGRWKVNEIEAADLYRQAMAASGLKTAKELAEWMPNQARLSVVEDGDGEVQGFRLDKTEKE